jgi:hypothetical protein
MKDEKGHGSEAHGGAAHQQGVADAGRKAAFNIAKAARDHFDAEHAKASVALNAFPKGPMGMTAPEVKASPEFKAAKQNYDTAFQRLRNYNAGYVKEYGSEIKAERLARRGS